MKIKLVFLDWQENGKSIYSCKKGFHLSTGNFHSGSTFEGTITLDREDERELRGAMQSRFHPCFWILAD